ncbi:MAG: outer membrane protein assembly factor BamA [Candidatus Omnitrophica bacterium]|nr:outer membrane protein assembly factor BamA [Candidatus Omnitrophota bacterium]
MKILPLPTSKLLSLVVAFVITFSLGLSIYAQDDGAAWEKKQIKEIDIIGNKTVSLSTLISKIKTKVGSEYSVKVARDDIKRLYALGYFDDVRIELEEVDTKVRVIFHVLEKPIIGSIRFKGTRRIHKRILQESMKTKEETYLDKQRLRQDLDEIKRIYARKGFSLVQTSYDSVLDEKNNKVTITIKVDEGLSARVRRVEVEGNSAFPDSRIISLIKTKPSAWWLFRKGYLDESTLEEDIQRLGVFYRSEGYSDVKIDKEILSLRLGWYRIVLKIQEGKRYFVGKITIEGNESFSSEEIKEYSKEMRPDAVFSQNGLEVDEFNIRSFYMDRGYIYAKVSAISSLNQKTEKVDIHFKITEHEINYVNLIKVRGNIKTKDVVIRRQLRLRPGDRFDGAKLRRSKERLYNLGFFDELEGIDFDIEPTQENNKSNLIVEVKETHTGAFSFGGGYSSIDQFIGFVELEQKNFDWKNFPYFTGGGQDLKLRASVGSITEMFDLSFTEPWLFDYPVSFGFDIYKEKRERETDVGFGYEEDKAGGVLRLGKELSEYWYINTFYQLEEIEISDIDDSATADFKKEEGKNQLSTLGLSATFDSRDNIFEPHKGLRSQNSFEFTGGPLGADKDFTKFSHSTSLFFPLPREAVAMFKVRLGIVNPFGDSDDVPIYERFFAGGSETIRGYNERKVGPIDTVTDDPIGGEALLVGNIEYLYPLWKHIRAAAFIDSGNVWRKMEDFSKGGFKTGIGVGLRIKTPLGPFKLDYGYPLQVEAGEEQKEGQLHFSFSRGF